MKLEKFYWTDIFIIVDLLLERYPSENPLSINFVDLHDRVINLPGFSDKPERSNEKILEAIQMEWINERNEDQ